MLESGRPRDRQYDSWPFRSGHKCLAPKWYSLSSGDQVKSCGHAHPNQLTPSAWCRVWHQTRLIKSQTADPTKLNPDMAQTLYQVLMSVNNCSLKCTMSNSRLHTTAVEDTNNNLYTVMLAHVFRQNRQHSLVQSLSPEQVPFLYCNVARDGREQLSMSKYTRCLSSVEYIISITTYTRKIAAICTVTSVQQE